MCWVFCLSPWMTMEHSISIIHCSIITIYPIIHYNSQWIQLISRKKKKTWFELNMLKNKYKQTNQNDVNALDDGEVVTHSRILTHTHTHIHRYTSRYALAYIRYTESKCLTFPIWIECQVLWSTVLELKMAGFIRTSSIKAYMSKRSIITPILFYYGAQRWVHFMSTIKKKERRRRRWWRWRLRMKEVETIKLIYSNSYLFNLQQRLVCDLLFSIDQFSLNHCFYWDMSFSNMHICFSFCIFLFIEKLEIEKFLSDIWLSSFNSFYSIPRCQREWNGQNWSK